jgi:hypothetical protein
MLPISSVPMSRGLTPATESAPCLLKRIARELASKDDPEHGRVESEATREPDCPFSNTRGD